MLDYTDPYSALTRDLENSVPLRHTGHDSDSFQIRESWTVNRIKFHAVNVMPRMNPGYQDCMADPRKPHQIAAPEIRRTVNTMEFKGDRVSAPYMERKRTLSSLEISPGVTFNT